MNETRSERRRPGGWPGGVPPPRRRDACGPAGADAGVPLLLAIVVIATLTAAPEAFACAVCYGAPDDPMVKGVNNGIWVLLGLVGFVQVGFIAMFWSFRKRAQEQKRFREQFHVIEGGPHS